MLLDLRSLVEDSSVVVVVIAPGGGDLSGVRVRTRQPIARRPTIHVDLGLLVGDRSALAAVWGGRAVQSWQGLLTDAGADLVGLDVFRPVVIWQTVGRHSAPAGGL